MTDSDLDAILALQLAVAWAGEAQSSPPRLGWWRTAMCDVDGGEDLLRRLTPKTWEWGVLESCRAAARRVDDRRAELPTTPTSSSRSTAWGSRWTIVSMTACASSSARYLSRRRASRLGRAPPGMVTRAFRGVARCPRQERLHDHRHRPTTQRLSSLRSRRVGHTTHRCVSSMLREVRSSPLQDAVVSSPAESCALPREADQVHTRLLQCALAVDESRAYWDRVDPDASRPSAQEAFDAFWFGAKSLPWVKILLLNMRARFDAFPEALRVLHAWRDMPPDTRAAICHWHLQLSDPLYRSFAGEFLLTRLRPRTARAARPRAASRRGRPRSAPGCRARSVARWASPRARPGARRGVSAAA